MRNHRFYGCPYLRRSEAIQAARAVLVEGVEYMSDEERLTHTFYFGGVQELAEDAAEELESRRQDSGSDFSHGRGGRMK